MGAAPGMGDVEGANGQEAVLARAQQAIATADDRSLLLCIQPAVRDGWLRDLVVELAIESSDRPLDADAALRARRAAVRRILTAHQATIDETPAAMEAKAIGDALLKRVPDRLALYTQLLGFAREASAPYDPARPLLQAVTEPDRSPLVRLVERVRSPAALLPDLADAGTEQKGVRFVASPSGPVPVRFVAQDGITWLDES